MHIQITSWHTIKGYGGYHIAKHSFAQTPPSQHAKAQQMTSAATTDEQKQAASEAMRIATTKQEGIEVERKNMMKIHEDLGLDAKVVCVTLVLCCM